MKIASGDSVLNTAVQKENVSLGLYLKIIIHMYVCKRTFLGVKGPLERLESPSPWPLLTSFSSLKYNSTS